MNKIILFEIIKELIRKYESNELNEKTYEEILNNTKFCSINSNLISYEETSVLSLLFRTRPYYQLFSYLNQFIKYLKSISTNSNSMFITNLIEGVLCDLISNLNNRVITEANAHLYRLCQIYYINLEIDYDLAIKTLTKNLINPDQLVGLDVAESINYQQERISGTLENDENLREKVSKRNFDTSNEIERKITKLLGKFFNADLLEDFENKLNKILEHYKQENPLDADLINEAIYGQFQSIKKKVSKKWDNQGTKKEEIPEQIDIFSLLKQKV